MSAMMDWQWITGEPCARQLPLVQSSAAPSSNTPGWLVGAVPMSSVVLGQKAVNYWRGELGLKDYQVILLSSAAISIIILIAQLAISALKSVREDEVSEANWFRTGFRQYAKTAHGSVLIWAYKASRMLGCLGLLVLSFAQLKFNGAKKPESWWVFANPAVYFYTFILSQLALSSRSRYNSKANFHLVSVLFFTLCVYAWRDVWPLAKFGGHPKDAAEGPVMWIRLGLLAFMAVFIPLFIPRRYIPVDPKEPALEPNNEQTTPLFSLVFYFFLDPIIFLAYRLPHLPVEKMPPLADYDQAKHLIKNAFPYLDPRSGAKKRHLFFNFMLAFRTEYTIMSLMVTLDVLFSFLSPIGLLRILEYLENPDQSSVKPWFWIICIFWGPTGTTLAMQWYVWVATRTICHAQAIITELVFEHSLRIRMKAESQEADGSSSSQKAAAPSASGAITPATDDDSVKAKQRNGKTTANESEQEAESSADERESTVYSEGEQREDGSGKSVSKEPSPAATPEKSEKVKVENKNVTGRINNLITTDMEQITDAKDFLFVALYIPLQIVLAIFFLYKILGWSSLVGLGIIIVTMPIPGWFASKFQTAQRLGMEKTDARVGHERPSNGEMFGWDTKIKERIGDARDAELKYIWRSKLLEILADMVNRVIPAMVMVATYTVYTVVMKESLSASKVFASIPVFGMLREQLVRIFWFMEPIIQGKVSLERLGDFLYNSELLDQFDERATPDSLNQLIQADESLSDKNGFRDASFSWSKETSEPATPSQRNYRLRVNGELFFENGVINLITGPTGSGKTSMLMALLSEMHFIPTLPSSAYNLRRAGGVAYAAQESWVQNATIRDNILFGSPLDQMRYDQVLYQCGLERDLSLFEAGDLTEVGERGLTLSGGQKARVTLARAVYSKAEVVLLDDILAALDVHTSQWVVDKCLRGSLLKGRTVILVAHNIALITPLASFIVHIHGNGKIATRRQEPAALIESHQAEGSSSTIVEATTESTDDSNKKETGKLIMKEEIQEGHVAKEAILMLVRAMAGDHFYRYIVIILLGTCLTVVFTILQTWYLGYWGSQYEKRPANEVDAPYYLMGYVLTIVTEMAIFNPNLVYYAWATLRASKTIHNDLMSTILGTTLRWLDSTPISRVITRCTQDMRAVDGPIPRLLFAILEMSFTTVLSLTTIVAYTPVFLLPGLIVGFVGAYAGNIYLKAQLSTKREMSNARAPVLAHFGAAINGITSIRAYGAQDAFRAESLNRIDRYTRIACTSFNVNRWISVRMDLMGSLFSAGLATYLVYGPHKSTSSTAGFSLNMAIQFSTHILWLVRIYNLFEVQSNSLERILGYTKIEQEPRPTESGKPPAAWPTSGELIVEKLSARYSPTSPEVLHDLKFRVKSGERIGIVGRTGSGKSSLTLSLLRCILTEGNVYYDGLSTDKINLDALRSNITIIPQVPEMLSGTLRRNLDPFEQHDDASLNDALRSAGLFNLQSDMDEGRLTLDSSIASGGGNLSVGQRQIIALARAFVRGSKVLILDEATSAIDYQTDAVIQSSLRQTLASDVTVLTIAHRLQTIIDSDRIMVLDAGKIVEFDTPKNLLKNKEGMLTALVEESMDKDVLYAMAESGRQVQ